MKKQRILSLLLALAMVFSLLPANAMAVDVKTFEDVDADAWYYKYVDFVTEKEFFVGTSKTTFSPEMSMTRAMFVTVLAAIEKVKVDNTVSPFADVPANTWYSGAVAWAAEKGVVAGIGDNKFAPDTAISREQMAVMMDAYVKWHSQKTGETHKEKSKVDGFKDADKISTWAKASVEKCRNWGLIAGMPDGNFWPQNTASRAEVATVIYNLVWLISGGGGGGTGGGGGGGGHSHNLVKTVANAATCTADGNKEYWTCAGTTDACGKFYSDANGATEVADGWWIIPALGHDYVGTVTTPPTCVDKGVKTYVCNNDPTHTYTEDIPATGHVDANGDFVCDICGTKLCTSHTPGAVVIENEVPATCTVAGSYDEVIYCSVCSTEISRVTKTTDLAAHTPGAAVQEDHIAPTDTVEGCYDMVVYCSVCSTEISREHNPIYDYIYRAVSAAVADLKADIEGKVNTSIPANGAVDWKDAYLGYTGLTLGANGDKRAIDFTVEADLGTDAIKAIVKFSAVNAVKLAGGTIALVKDPAAVAEVKAAVVKLVNEIVDTLKDYNITLSKESIDEIVDYVIDATKTNVSESVDYAEAYARSFGKFFAEDEGYVTGDVSIALSNGRFVNLDVEQNDVSLGEISTDKDVIDIASVYVRAIIADLKKVDTDALRSAIKNGVIKAVDFAKVKINSKAAAADFVNKTIDKVETKLNITIPMDSATIANLAVDVYDYALDKAYAGYVYGEKVWDALDANSDKITAVAYIAAVMAKDMYSDLKSYTEYTNLNDIVLDTALNVEFSGVYNNGADTAYKTSTDYYPYSYPVTFTLKMADTGSETTIGDNIQYKYNGIHNVKFIITEKMQAAYTALANKVVNTVVTPVLNAALQEALSKMNFSTMTAQDDGIMLLSDDDFSFDFDFSKININDLISQATNAWTADNLTTGDIANSPIMDYLNNKTGAESFDNTAIYNAVDKVLSENLDPVIDQLRNDDGSIPSAVAGLAANEENFLADELTTALQSALGDKFEQFDSMGLVDYAVAATRDKLDPGGELYNDGKKYTESSVVYDYDEETQEYIPVVVTPRQDMEAGVDKVVADAVDSAFKPTDGSAPVIDTSLIDTLKKALNLVGAVSDAENIYNASTSDLAAALTNSTFQSFIQGRGDSITKKLCSLIEKLPAKASLVIAGKVINEAALDGIRNATGTVDACNKLAAVLNELDLSLSTFKDTQVISVKYGSKSASFGLEIEMQ